MTAQKRPTHPADERLVAAIERLQRMLEYKPESPEAAQNLDADVYHQRQIIQSLAYGWAKAHRFLA